MQLKLAIVFALVLALAGCTAQREHVVWPGVERVLFLGDSITYDGRYVADVEACLRANEPERELAILNLGLPSETVSGLSEEGHAGGAFPRPVLSERLGRVLAAVKPELVVACYGMNDGIYLPLDEQRFASFRAGIESLRERCAASGARLVLLTPPVYDGHGVVDYDAVLTRYSDWLVEQRAQGWEVVDVHAAMACELEALRENFPKASFAPDGVHPDDEGHWIMARTLLEQLGSPDAQKPEGKVLELVRERQRIERDSGLSATKHLRPGLDPGLAPDEARARAGELETQLRALLRSSGPR